MTVDELSKIIEVAYKQTNTELEARGVPVPIIGGVCVGMGLRILTKLELTDEQIFSLVTEALKVIRAPASTMN